MKSLDIMPTSDSLTTQQRRAVVVHAGARDGYQLALALEESGQLEALVTDLFWSPETLAGQVLSRALPAGLQGLLRRRSAATLPASKVRVMPIAGAAGLLLDRVRRLPFALRQRLTRSADAALGRRAGRLARRTDAGLVSYSYYGFDAFRSYGPGGVLFQMHPHPRTMRRILREELAAHPECAASLEQEWELSLPEKEFDHLVRETELASAFLVASSFTRQSLIENGAQAESIVVVPYGVDLERFHPHVNSSVATRQVQPLRLLFVGRINQRKGLKYLLEALREFTPDQVHLTICGRVLDDLSLFRPFGDQVCVRPSVSAQELLAAYQAADLFVFPSVGEGFGQVLLESLACGLPVLATTHTAAPDLIADGVEGFIVEPRRPDLLADRIRWALTHRADLVQMRLAARARAEHFTWARFRTGVAAAVHSFLQAKEPVGSPAYQARTKTTEMAHV